ncbi:hypothetical protein [Rhizobium gallicum]|uniref:hypothetical protein n=1 Tax=Rhizobium gallicum TaxID=56730 RepID=UPI001EF7E496|nr:hypothetical protein [Rhizobium gallicum]ULJ76725.1 hypothetical protein L2W42_32800 [Rhizobium gallicum]
MAERDVELAAQAAALLRRRDQGRAFAEQFTVVVVAMNPIEDVQIIASPAYTVQTVRDALSALS